ncbi:MAG: TonB-dependent receptor [Prevotellaceae bacterium]|jgi:TonB-linked SusC/RagA family outer membrane protein|nr:TonB-dependent receptor [Prevotellaceae bacterium]
MNKKIYQNRAGRATPAPAHAVGGRLRRVWLLLLLCAVLPLSLLAQNLNISGTVVDANGDPVTGASVVVKGSSAGTLTGVGGAYSITAPADATLVFSFLGLASKEEAVGGRGRIDVVLSESSQAIDEVVVVGYGTMRKSDVTGSIAVAKADDILKLQSFSALEGLKGKASGVNIFSNSGQPGGAMRVIIRGMSTISTSSDPLYVVDGVVMEDFKLINPNDIDHIEVLKDASSAAIYGARGANGVIMVTTKRGRTDGGVAVSYQGSVSVGTVASYMDLLDANEWQDAFMQALANQNTLYGKSYSLNKADYFKDPNLFNADGTAKYNTDWQREATRTAVSHNHQLSVQQGDKNSSVGAFLNYTDQQGVMLNSYMKRVNAKMAYDANPTPWLSTAVNLLVNHTWGNEAEEDGGHQMPRRSMIEFVPFMPVTLNGEWTNNSTISDDLGLEGMANPVHVLTVQERMRKRTQIFGNAALTFHLLPGLDLKTQLGVDNHTNKYTTFSPSGLVNLSYTESNASIEDQSILYWQEETYLTYNKIFDDHRLNLMGGLSWQERVYQRDYIRTNNFDNFFGVNNLQAGTRPETPESSYERWAMNSYFLRGAYTYNDKYMLTVTGRVDGSSKFGKNNKYAFFPSAGLGWLASNEDFLRGVEAISLLKLHASYGVTGNSEIPVYQSLATMSSGNALLNDGRVATSYTYRLANPDLKWERTNQFDIGFNLNFFRNRLNFDVSYYYKLTTDLLMSRPVPHSTGFSSVMDNIGSVSNIGVDFMLNSVNFASQDFRWTTTLNLNYNKNTIEKLGENDEDILTGPWFVSNNLIILRKGESLSSFWGYERTGLDAANGRAIRSDAPTILGNGLPDLTGSFINNLSYKNFDLTVDFQFVAGVDVYQQFLHSTEDRFGIANGLSTILTDAWTPTNKDTEVQAIGNAYSAFGGVQSSAADSRWVCDGSYLRLNLIQLGYTFDSPTLSRLKLGALRAYLNVSNVFVLHASDFLGYDPEATSNPSDRWGQNVFFFQYPKPRTFTLGLNVTF